MSAIADPERLTALRATGLLDSAAEACFDRLTRLAHQVLGTPVVLVALVDERREFFKSAIGLPEPWASRRETDLSRSLCRHVVAASAPLVVDDAAAHPLVCDSPAIRDLGVRAYAGVPLVAEGHDLGAFCAIDTAPRRWRPDELATLRAIADSVETEIALRAALGRVHDQEAVLRALYEGSQFATAIADLGGAFVRVNPAFEALLGYTEAELRGRLITELSPPEDRDDQHALITGASRGGSGAQRDKWYVRKDGRRFWGRVTVGEVRDRDGRPMYMTGMVVDITAEKQVADALALSDQTHRAIVANLPRGAVLMVDAAYRYVAASGPALPEILSLVGIDSIVGRSVHEVVGTVEGAAAAYERYRLGFTGVEQQFELAFAGHAYEGRMVPLRDAEQRVTHVLVFYDDVTTRKAEADALRAANTALGVERELFRTTLRHLRDGVALVGTDHRVLLANTTYCAMLDISPDRVIGLTMQQLVAHLAPRVTDPEALEVLTEQPTDTVKYEIVIARPRRRVLERTFSPLTSADGAGFLAVWRDITAERDLADERDRQIYTDALTGIPNRRAADRALAVEVSRQRRTQARLSIALFDLDHFKRINDVHGHVAGDEVLRHIGETLSREARITDTVARWGGEEFIAILPVGLAGALVFCERVRAAIEQLELPVGPITISAGVAELTDGEDPTTAIARADAGLYVAKRGGRNRVGGGPPA